jgi:outer membrane receptor protein involved in Fe transport
MSLSSPLARRLTLALSLGACPAFTGSARAQHAVALDEISVTATGPARTASAGEAGVTYPPADPLPGLAPAVKSALSPSVAALPANTTLIDAAQIARLPVQNAIDVLRPLAGIDVSNFGQGGVGNGIALRGFDGTEHARNIAFFIDGVPINEVSSIHIPNYVDLNPLIPETVRTISIVRGPFSVEEGDGALGGAVFIETKRADPFNTVSVSGGSFDTLRGLATFSQAGAGLQPFLAYEGYNSGGYRQNGDLGRFNAFNKVTIPLDLGSSLSLRVQTYATTFGEPGYIARDLVRAGLLSPRAAFNPTDGGSKTAQNVVANYVSGAPDDEVSAVLYASHDLFGRFSDFGGGQGGQVEERETVGGRFRKVWTRDLFDILPAQVLVGGDWRTDRIDVVTGPSVARSLTGRTLNLGVLQTDLAAYAQVQIKPAPWLKLTGGARFDQFVFDVANRLDPTASPKASPNVVSPKGGAAATPFDWLELFANYGQGFRSPSATGELTSNPRLTPQTIESTEGGGRLILDRASLTGTVFSTDIANEIFQTAPDLPVQNLGRSRRDGFEIEARYIAYRDGLDRIGIFASYSGVTARLLTGPRAVYVPNVPGYLAKVGAEFNLGSSPWLPLASRVTGTAYLTYTGAKPLSEDGRQRTSPFPRVSGRIAYVDPSGWTAFGQATWYPGSRVSEIALNFGDVASATSADIYTSPVPRLTLLAGVSFGFPTAGARPWDSIP